MFGYLTGFNTTETGNKTIVRGIITKRYEEGDESSTYHIQVDAIEFTVKQSVYEKYQLGDAAEFHIFKPYSNFVLYDKRLEGAGLNDLEKN